MWKVLDLWILQPDARVFIYFINRPLGDVKTGFLSWLLYNISIVSYAYFKAFNSYRTQNKQSDE